MIDITWFELLHQVIQSIIAQLMNVFPERFLIMNFDYSVCRSFRARFQYPRSWNVISKLIDVVIVKKRSKLRDFNMRIMRFDAHGKLVAEESPGGLTHSRNSEIFTEIGSLFHI